MAVKHNTMKKRSLFLLPLLYLFFAGCHSGNGTLDNNGADTVGLMMNNDSNAAKDLMVSNATFDQQLSPYGTWRSNARYGRVWIPHEGRRFRPYCSHGHWVYSDAGWTWDSDYRWGWAPFHYGRWSYDDEDGWFWVPGNEWAPAWVTWGRCNDYYGWAPLAPGISIDISFGSRWRPPADYWNFIPERDFVSEREYDRVVNVYSDPQIVNSFSNNVTVINNYPERNIYQGYYDHPVYNAGPQVYEVERATHQHIMPVALRETTTPMDRVANRQMNIYSPGLQQRVQNNFAANRGGRNNQYNAPAGNYHQQPAGNYPAQNNYPVANTNHFQGNRDRNGLVQQNAPTYDRQYLQRQDNHAAFRPAGAAPSSTQAYSNNTVVANNRRNGFGGPGHVAPQTSGNQGWHNNGNRNFGKPVMAAPAPQNNFAHGRQAAAPSHNNWTTNNNRPVNRPQAPAPQSWHAQKPSFNRPQQAQNRPAPQQWHQQQQQWHQQNRPAPPPPQHQQWQQHANPAPQQHQQWKQQQQGQQSQKQWQQPQQQWKQQQQWQQPHKEWQQPQQQWQQHQNPPPQQHQQWQQHNNPPPQQQHWQGNQGQDHGKWKH